MNSILFIESVPIRKIMKPSLFDAATNDDLREMKVALEDGQSLLFRREPDGFSPLHLAIQHGSKSFSFKAIDLEPNCVWLLDARERLPIDYAFDRGDHELIHKIQSIMSESIKFQLDAEVHHDAPHND